MPVQRPYESGVRPHVTSYQPTYQRPKEPIMSEAVAGAAKIGAAALDQHLRQRDELAAQNALLRFSDASRKRLFNTQQLQGYAAIGATEKSMKDIDDDIEAIASELPSERAKLIFKQRALQKRGATLNAISSYEAGQLQVAKQSSVENSMAEVQRAITVGIDPDYFDAELNNLKQSISVFYDGTSLVSAKQSEAQQKLTTYYLMNEAQRNPSRIPALLKRYASSISDADANKITKAARAFEITEEADTVLNIVRAKTNDPEKALSLGMKISRDLGIDPKAKTRVINTLKNEWATQTDLDKKREQDIQDELGRKAVVAWKLANYDEVERYALAMPNPTEARVWLNIVNEVRSGKRNRFAKSDPATLADIKEKLYKNPTKVNSVGDIWQKVGHGLSSADAQKLDTLRSKLIEKGTSPEIARIIDIIKQFRKQKVLDSDDYKNEQEFVRIRNELFDWVEQHPGDDPYTKFLKPIMEEKQKGFLHRLWDQTWDRLFGNEEEGPEPEPVKQVVRKKIQEGQ